jgi:dTDP-4-dehydrorhamnose 3,5-epimerase
MRVFDKKQFKEQGLNSEFVQQSISFSKKTGTIRGMHFRNPPHEEEKLVYCTRGKILDIIIDLRPNSKTFKKWDSVELSGENLKINYIPKGIAHGFQTLEDNTLVHYHMSKYYNPKYDNGVRWNDPTFNIKWPLKPSVINARDNSWKLFET